MVELYTLSTAGEAISLRQELYRMKMSKEEGIASYFMKIYEIKDQLQDLGEVMSDREMTRVVLNALTEEWGNFMLRQFNYLSFNCQPGGFVKLVKHACTVYARN